MSYTHEVIRPMRGLVGPGGVELAAGDLVDASGWRSAGRLERSRHIKRLDKSSALREQVTELEAENDQLRKGVDVAPTAPVARAQKAEARAAEIEAAQAKVVKPRSRARTAPHRR